MSKHNYTNYSNPKPAEAPVEPVVKPVVTEQPTADVEAPIETPVKEEPVEAVKEILGEVVDCKRLRVRKTPSRQAEVLCEIEVGSTVKIDSNASTADFYKVCTEAGVEGYCMNSFVSVE